MVFKKFQDWASVWQMQTAANKIIWIYLLYDYVFVRSAYIWAIVERSGLG